MELPVEAAIEAVTVYSERALIVRRGSVTIESPGEHTLKIGGLPQTIQPNSLRANGRGPAGTRILGIEQETEIHAEPPVEELQRLSQEITRLRREIELTGEQQQIIEEQREWLRTLGEQSARRIANGIAGSTAKPEDASAVFTFAGDEAQRLARAKLELDTRREELQKELEARGREHRELSASAKPDRLAASVRVEMATPGKLDIELSYLISGASWRPRYDARVDVAASQVRLTQQALVTQRTGEDWQQVALSLSTARPNAAVTLPDEPDPWYVDVFAPPPPQPIVARAPAQAMKMHAATFAAPAAAPEERERGITFGATVNGDQLVEAVEAEIATAPVERSGAAQVFRVPGGVDVPSDGTPHTLGLGESGLPCRFDYVAAPIIAAGAHLRATATNTTGGVLLPGSLHVFHAGADGDEYVGATMLDSTAEGAEIKLYLGVDDNVTVKRELIERDTDKGSLLQSGIRRITFGYRVTLANRTETAQRVVLKDRLPVPRHERIKLKVLDIRPQPSARTRLEQLTWELQLAPGQEQRVEWRFVVEAPADMALTGLP
jgi:uncharacterized protein (TIGR02231 family)